MKNSPLNELTAQDIARKQKKLDRIDKRIDRKDDKFKAKVASGKKGTDMDITRHERSLSGLKERKHKTEHQIKTGERGRPTSLRNEAWLAGTEGYNMGNLGPSRKSALNMLGVKSSPLNQEYDKDYKGDANKLIEEVKNEAANYAPEYDPPPTQSQREADPNYKFFITNANNESNEVARKMDSLKYHVKFDKNKKPNLQMQKDLKNKHNLK